MAGDGNRFVSYLDKLLPFLEVSPPWFRTWIYILTVLIGLTIALGVIFYLKAPRTLGSFSVERPKPGEQIPLPASRRHFVEGKFPILREPVEHSVMIEVFRLPEREGVPQEGKPRINPVDGQWEHESVQFAGPGSHEIIATAHVGGWSVYRKVLVSCIGKAEHYQADIGRDRRLRAVPELAPARREEVDLQKVYQETSRLQEEFFSYYPGNLKSALQTVNRTFDVLDRILPLFPDDIYLQNVRAYTFKNYAMVMRDLGRQEEFDRSLGQAEKMFAAIRDQAPRNVGAWNGLGSVHILRGRPEEALRYIDRALELDPNYEAARQDRETALRLLRASKPSQ